MVNNLIIAVDFDGTIVEHAYPQIGKPIDLAIDTLKLLQTQNKIILLTMRSGRELEEAVKYLTNNGIVLYAVNDNPSQNSWTSSRKVYAHIYIDDASLGCPLQESLCENNRHKVDWKEVRRYFEI